MRLGTGRSLASAARSSQTCRAFSSTVQLASKASAVPEPENMRQAHRPRMQTNIFKEEKPNSIN